MARKGKKQKKKGFPVFYTIYWLLVLVAVVGIAVGSRYLWKLCADYEAVQPKYAAAPYQDIYTQGRIEEMLALSGGGIELCPYERQEDYLAYIRELLSGKEITCQSVYSPDDGQKLYVAKADGKRFSQFTLKKAAGKSDFGFDKWEFDQMVTELDAPVEVYRVQVFSNYQVYVNDTLLPESYITEKDIATFAEGKLPGSIYTPRYVVYEFPAHFGVPELRVATAEGEEGVLLPDEGSETAWHMELNNRDDAVDKELSDYVLKAAKAYCTFISEDTSRAGILNYVLKKSNAADYINAYDNDWFTPHKSYSFSHEVTRNYIYFADNCFSVDVQMAFHMSSSSGKEARYPIAYRFYWGYSKDAKRWLIFDYEIIDYDYELHDSLNKTPQE